MKKIWLSSDYHFNHDNIRKYSERPFSTLEEMNETIINNHNSLVEKNDTFIFLGDFHFRNVATKKRAEDFINKLNGRITFVEGNHDHNNNVNTPIIGLVLHYGGYDIWCCHDPKEYEPNFKINFVGHVHRLWKIKKMEDGTILVNVGVDVWDYKPVSINTIFKSLKKGGYL